METTEVKKKYDDLSIALKHELSKMERSDRVFKIRDEIKALQNICPHNMGSYDFSNTEECPYCGKKFKG